MRKLTSANILR